MAKTRQELFAEWNHKKELIAERLKANPDDDDKLICESLADKHADLEISQADVATVRGPSVSRLLVFSVLVIAGFGLMAAGYFLGFFLVFPGSQLALMNRKQVRHHYRTPLAPSAVRQVFTCLVVALVVLIVLMFMILDSSRAREFLEELEHSANYRLGSLILLFALTIWMLADRWWRWFSNRQKIRP